MILQAVENMKAFINDLGLPANVTESQIEAANHLDQGRAAIIVSPPSIETATLSDYEFTFELYVTAGPFADTWRALEKLDHLVTALMESRLQPLSADARTFETVTGKTYPCYVLPAVTYSH